MKQRATPDLNILLFSHNYVFSHFIQVDQIDPTYDLIIRFLTNNRASENSYTIRDNAGDIVFERSNFSNGTLYKDEVNLPAGCYTLTFEDTGNDGLDFWYWAAIGQNVGTGSLSIARRITPTLDVPVKQFNPDFGGTLYYDFVVGDITSTTQEETPSLFSAYPNPTSDLLNIDLVGLQGQDIKFDLISVFVRVLTVFRKIFR